MAWNIVPWFASPDGGCPPGGPVAGLDRVGVQDLEVRYATHPDQVRGFDTALRGSYLVEDLFTPDTITAVLASAASGYVNGHVLAVDGGWLAR